MRIGRDKIKHFLAGLAIAIVAGLLLYPVMVALQASIPWVWLKWLLNLFVVMGAVGFGMFAAAVAGAAKELVWDWLLKHGKPEWLDFWATVAGGVIGIAVLKLIGK